MRALLATCSILLVALILNTWLWLRWRDGTVIVESRSPRTREVIRVRDVPSDAPFWAASFGRFVEDHLYRCEYSDYGMSQFMSAQTYSDRGYQLSGISVAWQDDGAAVVSLDGKPLFHCKDGWWSKAP